MNENQIETKIDEIYDLANSILREFSEFIDSYSMELVKHLETKKIDQRNRESGSESGLLGYVMNMLPAPGNSPTGLAFDGSYLWVADSLTDKVYMLDLKGNILSSCNLPESTEIGGLAANGDFLWVAVNQNEGDKIYRLSIH